MAVPYDQVLQALVYQAFDVRGTPAARQAAQEIIDTHARWPLVQYAIELRYARMVLRTAKAEEAELWAWYTSIGYGDIQDAQMAA